MRISFKAGETQTQYDPKEELMSENHQEELSQNLLGKLQIIIYSLSFDFIVY
jgi:hypothetical protein